MQLSDKPDRLGATFQKTLNGWRRESRFLDYRASQDWAAEMRTWLGQIERELLTRDPMAVVTLAESFIDSDATFFDRADDSSGCIGDAMRAACRLWLQAAARCEAPPDTWQPDCSSCMRPISTARGSQSWRTPIFCCPSRNCVRW